MVNEQLVNYFKEGVEKGTSLEVLKINLINEGWPEVDVRDAMKEISGNQEPAPGKQNVSLNFSKRKRPVMGIAHSKLSKPCSGSRNFPRYAQKN